MVAVAVLECIGHKQNSLHARLPTEPILEIYDKQENGGVAEGEWGQYPWGGGRAAWSTNKLLVEVNKIDSCQQFLFFFKDSIWLPVNMQTRDV